ncbi:MAG: type IV pili methyl-accepting chemotaxis transducer N-terminal domain-containing protein [Pseudomonadota bacterium]
MIAELFGAKPFFSKRFIRPIALGLLMTAPIGAPALATGPGPSTSAGIVEDVGGGARIDMAGKLRMLSQRIPMTACNVQAGIETEAAVTMMTGAVAEFQKIITALEYGDDSLGIYGAEEDRRVLYAVADVHEIWAPLHADVQRADPAAMDVALVTRTADTSHDLLKRAQALVDAVTGEHSDPSALLQSDAITIGIAGRQRMLAQRMSKNACLLAEGHFKESAASELAAAMETYDASLNALRFGMDNAGIVSPPNSAIEDGLAEIAADWISLQASLDDIRDGAHPDAETRAMLYHGLNGLTGKMNVVVGLYAEASKLGL